MKKYVWILMTLTITACYTNTYIPGSLQRKVNVEYQIVNTPLVVKNDTINVNELRFYKIKSAYDGVLLMYQNYGKWDQKIKGKHQNNIEAIIWKNIELICESEEKFTVIADGTETLTDYFACLMVFDSNGKDCFQKEHPYKDKLTELFVEKMKKTDKSLSAYRFID